MLSGWLWAGRRKRRRTRAAATLAAAAGLCLSLAAAAPRPVGARAVSVGSPTEGRLEAGVRLEARDGRLRLRAPEGAVWGLPQLVRLLDRSSRAVHRKYPGSVLLVGDLSLRGGGNLGGHHSHESGRDADVGFYFVDRKGAAAEVDRFLQVLWNGRAAQRPDLEFDDARNWALVQAWLTSGDARVQHIFVAEPLRQRLLRYATKAGVYLPVRHRAAIVMKQPSRGLPHDDHFHVRIDCPSDQPRCVSEPPRRPARRERDRSAPRPVARRTGPDDAS